jgi:hypothetical protein
MDHDPAAVLGYLSGELDPDARERFERHLVDCDRCWAAVREDIAGRAVAESAREPVPPLLRDRVRFAVETETRPARRTKRRLVSGVAMALAAIITTTGVVIGGIGRLGGHRHPADPPSVAAVVRLVGREGAGLEAAPAARLSIDGQLIAVSRVDMNGTPVLVARSDRPFVTTPDAQPMTNEEGPWLVRRGLLSLVCFNHPHPVLLAARLPANQLAALAAQLDR